MSMEVGRWVVRKESRMDLQSCSHSCSRSQASRSFTLDGSTAGFGPSEGGREMWVDGYGFHPFLA